jgi:hypothetical protein
VRAHQSRVNRYYNRADRADLQGECVCSVQSAFAVGHVTKGAHTRKSLSREPASGSLIWEPGSDIVYMYIYNRPKSGS